MNYYRRVPLWGKIMIGLALGILIGIIFGEKALWLKEVGNLFINAIKMLIVPLIFSSLVDGVTNISDVKKMGRIGIKTIIIYLITTGLAITIGLILGSISGLGKGVSIQAPEHSAIVAKSSTISISSLIPSNPIAAMASGDILAIIVFAILVGIAINFTGKKAEPAKIFFNSIAEIMYKLTGIIMEFAPYGVAALIACVIGEHGIAFVIPLLKVVAVVYIGCIIHAIITFAGALSLIAKLNPLKYFKGFLDATILSFSIASSSGTLPISMSCAQKKLGVSESISSFVQPLGATINMDGTALYQGICAIFIANVYGIDLTFNTYVTMVITCVLASVGTAGIPGAGLIMLGLVLKAAGLPIEGIAIIAGIDRILDMARTCINVVGDGMVAVLIAKTENELDLAAYNSSSNK